MGDSGTIVTPPNEPRLANDEKWGHFLGMVFGDGGSAYIPSSENPHWVSESSPVTLFAIGMAPPGVVWLKWGDLEIEGVGGHKLHVIELPDGESLTNRLELFPNRENISEDCYVMLVKYYNQTNIDLGEEGEAMDELNQFVNGAWS